VATLPPALALNFQPRLIGTCDNYEAQAMSAIGPYRKRLSALHMSGFEAKADIHCFQYSNANL